MIVQKFLKNTSVQYENKAHKTFNERKKNFQRLFYQRFYLKLLQNNVKIT